MRTAHLQNVGEQERGERNSVGGAWNPLSYTGPWGRALALPLLFAGRLDTFKSHQSDSVPWGGYACFSVGEQVQRG